MTITKVETATRIAKEAFMNDKFIQAIHDATGGCSCKLDEDEFYEVILDWCDDNAGTVFSYETKDGDIIRGGDEYEAEHYGNDDPTEAILVVNEVPFIVRDMSDDDEDAMYGLFSAQAGLNDFSLLAVGEPIAKRFFD